MNTWENGDRDRDRVGRVVRKFNLLIICHLSVLATSRGLRSHVATAHERVWYCLFVIVHSLSLSLSLVLVLALSHTHKTSPPGIGYYACCACHEPPNPIWFSQGAQTRILLSTFCTDQGVGICWMGQGLADRNAWTEHNTKVSAHVYNTAPVLIIRQQLRLARNSLTSLAHTLMFVFGGRISLTHAPLLHRHVWVSGKP
jgi:hypothetical protein